jgi:alanine racemase
MPNTPLTWVEVNRKHFQHNTRNLRRLAGRRLLAPAVKANAYGHGLKEITGLLLDEKVDYVSVHSLSEAQAVRESGWGRKILVVGYIPLADLGAVFDLELELTVYNLETIRKIGRLSNRFKKDTNIHLKIETGTNRQGITLDRTEAFVRAIKKFRYLKLKGVATHFANIEDTTDHSYARNQLQLFRRAVADIRRMGLKPELCHTACSAALLLFDETRFDLVRPGIALYGLWPSKETYLSYRLQGKSNEILKPVLSWKTRVAQIKRVPRNSFIGYGCTYRTTSDTRLAVLPIGYSDGYDRGLSNLAYVLINGQRAPVRGRVCMNLIMVDITDIRGVKLEQVVTLIGRDGDEFLGVDQLALWAQTVNYEIIGRINHQIPRIIV